MALSDILLQNADIQGEPFEQRKGREVLSIEGELNAPNTMGGEEDDPIDPAGLKRVDASDMQSLGDLDREAFGPKRMDVGQYDDQRERLQDEQQGFFGRAGSLLARGDVQNALIGAGEAISGEDGLSRAGRQLVQSNTQAALRERLEDGESPSDALQADDVAGISPQAARQIIQDYRAEEQQDFENQQAKAAAKRDERRVDIARDQQELSERKLKEKQRQFEENLIRDDRRINLAEDREERIAQMETFERVVERQQMELQEVQLELQEEMAPIERAYKQAQARLTNARADALGQEEGEDLLGQLQESVRIQQYVTGLLENTPDRETAQAMVEQADKNVRRDTNPWPGLGQNPRAAIDGLYQDFVRQRQNSGGDFSPSDFDIAESLTEQQREAFTGEDIADIRAALVARESARKDIDRRRELEQVNDRITQMNETFIRSLSGEFVGNMPEGGSTGETDSPASAPTQTDSQQDSPTQTDTTDTDTTTADTQTTENPPPKPERNSPITEEQVGVGDWEFEINGESFTVSLDEEDIGRPTEEVVREAWESRGQQDGAEADTTNSEEGPQQATDSEEVSTEEVEDEPTSESQRRQELESEADSLGFEDADRKAYIEVSERAISGEAVDRLIQEGGIQPSEFQDSLSGSNPADSAQYGLNRGLQDEASRQLVETLREEGVEDINPAAAKFAVAAGGDAKIYRQFEENAEEVTKQAEELARQTPRLNNEDALALLARLSADEGNLRTELSDLEKASVFDAGSRQLAEDIRTGEEPENTTLARNMIASVLEEEVNYEDTNITAWEDRTENIANDLIREEKDDLDRDAFRSAILWLERNNVGMSSLREVYEDYKNGEGREDLELSEQEENSDTDTDEE